MTYTEYLESDHWKSLRYQKIHKNRKCLCCRSKKDLDVHHSFYRPDWTDAEPEDLIVLCRNCHKALHELMDNGSIQFSRLKRSHIKGIQLKLLREHLGLKPKTGLTYGPGHMSFKEVNMQLRNTPITDFIQYVC